MAAIDVGPGAIARTDGFTSGYTIFSFDNPANAAGNLDTVELWFRTNGVGVRVGTFFLVSGTTYQCRDSVVIGAVTAGSKQTFSGLTNFDVTAGDYIGCYYTGGSIERGYAGGLGYAYCWGENIDPGDQGSYTLVVNPNFYIISIYGTGTEAGGGPANISKFNGIAKASIGKIDGIALASISKVCGV